MMKKIKKKKKKKKRTKRNAHTSIDRSYVFVITCYNVRLGVILSSRYYLFSRLCDQTCLALKLKKKRKQNKKKCK